MSFNSVLEEKQERNAKTKQERNAIKDLKNDDNIIILSTDKGRMTVIMNKSDYIDKAETLLKDANTYQPLDTDPSKTTMNNINKKLKHLKYQDKLSETTYNRTRPNDATIAKFYAKFMQSLIYTKKTFHFDQSFHCLDHQHTVYQNT